MSKLNHTMQTGLRAGAVLAAVAALSACSTLSALTGGNADYKGAAKASSRPLEVPPDLTQLARDNRYAIPDQLGTATASSYQQGAQPGAASTVAGQPAAAVAPITLGDIRVERSGNTRWLAVKRPPEQVYAAVKEFWQANGFNIVSESPATGVMETDWVENRSKIPESGIRAVLGKAIDGMYSTGERDKYRTRLERTADGGTEVYISHRGAEEVLTGVQKDTTTWTVRPNDPNLEAAQLSRLMAHMGATEPAKTVAAVTSAAPGAPHAKLVGTAGAAGAYAELDEGFDRAWRRVGLALDRSGFTVEDRDRVSGIYFVRFVDNDAADAAKREPGFFAKLFTFGAKDKGTDGQRYRVWVKGDAANTTQVVVLNNESKPEVSSTAGKILNLLVEQLK
jgi:outer membrane protein assembly factor BamC